MSSSGAVYRGGQVIQTLITPTRRTSYNDNDVVIVQARTRDHSHATRIASNTRTRQDTAATDRWRKGRRRAPASVAHWEVPEPVRKARQARPLSPPRASWPSGLFKSIDPVSVALSIRPRARPIRRDFVARCAGTPRSLRREGKRTWLEVPARQARNGFIRHLPSRSVLVARCNLLRVATKRGRCRVRAELCSKESPLSCSTRLHSNEHNRKQPLFFLPAHPPQKEQLEAECGCLHFGSQDRNRFGLRV